MIKEVRELRRLFWQLFIFSSCEKWLLLHFFRIVYCLNDDAYFWMMFNKTHLCGEQSSSNSVFCSILWMLKSFWVEKIRSNHLHSKLTSHIRRRLVSNSKKYVMFFHLMNLISKLFTPILSKIKTRWLGPKICTSSFLCLSSCFWPFKLQGPSLKVCAWSWDRLATF